MGLGLNQPFLETKRSPDRLHSLLQRCVGSPGSRVGGTLEVAVGQKTRAREMKMVTSTSQSHTAVSDQTGKEVGRGWACSKGPCRQAVPLPVPQWAAKQSKA